MPKSSSPVEEVVSEAEETSTLKRPARAERSGRNIPTVAFSRGNKQLYTYRDVLNEAHLHGFMGFQQLHPPIITTNERGQITSAVCSVVALFADGSQFHGTGDADIANAGQIAGDAKVRMADTRAKARALGDALNLDANFSEEMGPDNDETPKEPVFRTSRTSSSPTSTTQASKLDDRLPDPGPGPYLCAVCNEPIKPTERYSDAKLAQWSIRDFGEIRCWTHGRGAKS